MFVHNLISQLKSFFYISSGVRKCKCIQSETKTDFLIEIKIRIWKSINHLADWGMPSSAEAATKSDQYIRKSKVSWIYKQIRCYNNI